TGTNFINEPNPNTPESSCRAPQTIPIYRRLENPNCSTFEASNTDMAAAGPLTARGVPPNRAQTSAPTISVMSPSAGGTPDASLMASESGMATNETVRLAIKTTYKYLSEKRDFNSGSKHCNPKSYFMENIKASSRYSETMFSTWCVCGN